MTTRLRFAPSPTGYLHVGNIRTALINYLFARQQGGEFMLRMDDTDIARSTDEYAAAIEEDLHWLGLHWDLFDKQSARFDAYHAAADALKASGRLYACYETPEELELKRKVQLSRGLPPVYDREALNLTSDERAALEAEGKRPHWRFKLDHEHVVWDDLVRGEVSVDTASVSDPILIREDGSLLYTLPSVVDDIEFGITHVVRGEDHVTNTAAQVQVFHALGGDPPRFAHHALLTGKGGEGLSKRLGSLSIRDLRAEGLEPMAINSLLARLGTSDPVEPFGEIQPLIEGLDFSRFGRAAAKFDPDELAALNAKIVHNLPFDAATGRIAGLTPAIWQAVRGNLEKLSDANAWVTVVNGPIEPVREDFEFVDQAASLLPDAPWDEMTWGSWTKAVKEATGRKGRDLFLPLRLALTGLEHGPEMKLMLPLIGPERAHARLAGEVA
ncbi:MAG: glutamate--tRNA ligase [Alphaproteobacteria bacterium]